MNHKHCIDTCNSLLRGERSAVETYDQALDQYPDDHSVATELIQIRTEHMKAVRVLEANVRSMGGEPDAASGSWGTMAVVVQATANIFGTDSAIASLRQGEETGRKKYEKALADTEVMDECKNLIEAELLPPLQEHVARLEALQKAA